MSRETLVLSAFELLSAFGTLSSLLMAVFHLVRRSDVQRVLV